MENDILFRRAVLIQLEAASPASLPSATISAGLKLAGFSFCERELFAVLDYLRGKGFVLIARSELSASHLRVRLSASGRDYLESGEY